MERLRKTSCVLCAQNCGLEVQVENNQIIKSRFDGRDVFQFDYTAYRSLLGMINMVDEIRKVKKNLYLGVGTIGFTKKQRLKPLPFILSGPAEPFMCTDKPYKKLL